MNLFSCDTRMVSFFLHLNVIPVELIVQYVSGARPDALSPPSLHPSGTRFPVAKALSIMRVGTGDLGAGGCWDPGGFLSVTPCSPS